MPQQAWSDKRERQYQHIKSSTKNRGAGEDRAEEIAARTVNKNRARSGESTEASRSSIDDVSPQHRGGVRAGRGMGPGGPTKDQLYNEAKQRNIKGRSSMTKRQLENALGRR
jgi:plasmid stabilization system protein ParE